MLYNTIHLNDRRTHHTPGHNLFMEIIIRRYQKNHQLKKRMNIIRNNEENCKKMLILFQSHVPHNDDGPKFPGGGGYKSNN